jgi:hypothetical protein
VRNATSADRDQQGNKKIQTDGTFLVLKNASQNVFKFVQNVPSELKFLNCSGVAAFPSFGLSARVLRRMPDWIDPPGIETVRDRCTGIKTKE